jgi:hypothetical protein
MRTSLINSHVTFVGDVAFLFGVRGFDMRAKQPFYRKCFYAALVLSIIIGGSHCFGYEWSKSFTYTGSYLEEETGRSVQQTFDGGYIIAGIYIWDAHDHYIYLIKTDAAGNELWSKTFGGGDARGYSVQQTTDNGYIVAGLTRIPEEKGEYDLYIIKTDDAGNELWSKTFGGSNSEWGWSVQQTTDGGYIIVGFTESFAVSLSDRDAYLVKTDAAGNELWSKTFPGIRSFDGYHGAYGYSVQQTTNGGYIITGSTLIHIKDRTSDAYLVYYRPHLTYTPVTPCRIVDTRKAGGAFSPGTIRS